jgi:peptidoglycan/xylan/chitin deacetylase (PgdA/CDA1 family)
VKNSIKLFTRKYIFPFALSLNIDKLILKFNSKSCLNIYFHGVTPQNFLDISGRHMQLSQFERLIEYLSKNYHVIALNDAYSLKDDKISAKRKIIISFDDGYENNLIYALPILKKYNMPATFFICGVSLQSSDFIMWTDLVALCRFWEKSEVIVLNQIEFVKQGPFSMYNSEMAIDGYEYLKRESLKTRNKVFEELMIKYNVKERIKEIDSSYWKLLNTEQINEIAKDPLFEIASHGMMHHNLAYIDINTAKLDIEDSKKVLENATKKEIVSISFPDGNYNSDVKNLCKNAGFKHLLAVDYKLKEDYEDSSILSRFGISSTTTFESNVISIAKAFNKNGF